MTAVSIPAAAGCGGIASIRAVLPDPTGPAWASMPAGPAGLIVSLATWRRMRALSAPGNGSSGRGPARSFVTLANCQHFATLAASRSMP